MTLVLILFGLGIALVAIEIVVPGGVLGIFGGISLTAGVITSFSLFGSRGGTVATGLALLIVGVTLYLEFVLLPKTRLVRKFSMHETVSGRSQPDVAQRDLVLNRDTVAITTLAPSGYVELEGRRYEAFCRSGHVSAGTRLRVVDVDTFRLVVTQIKETS